MPCVMSNCPLTSGRIQHLFQKTNTTYLCNEEMPQITAFHMGVSVLTVKQTPVVAARQSAPLKNAIFTKSQ